MRCDISGQHIRAGTFLAITEKGVISRTSGAPSQYRRSYWAFQSNTVLDLGPSIWFLDVGEERAMSTKTNRNYRPPIQTTHALSAGVRRETRTYVYWQLSSNPIC